MVPCRQASLHCGGKNLLVKVIKHMKEIQFFLFFANQSITAGCWFSVREKSFYVVFRRGVISSLSSSVWIVPQNNVQWREASLTERYKWGNSTKCKVHIATATFPLVLHYNIVYFSDTLEEPSMTYQMEWQVISNGFVPVSSNSTRTLR